MSWTEIKKLAKDQPQELFLPIVNLLLETPNPERLIEG